MNEKTQVLKLLSGDTRFRIIEQLLEKPDYTVNLSAKLNIESSMITHSLKKLEKHGIVRSRRKGKLKYYEIRDKKTVDSLLCNIDQLNGGRV